ncbi:protein ABHD18 [Elysia marginata]|uniref:Protein ABHD18 n=1 Tax=Elysia marginata TaxID=1093978 RepID=A0AAV4J4D1_9GAST|nr:protein ABHD18 [Elysia marginata]
MSVSRVDQLYRKLLLTKFFTKGWGKPDNLKRLFAFRKILSNRDQCQHLVSADYPIHIDKEYRDGGFRILEGHFTSPFVHHMPGIMPPEVEKASFQMILPVKWRDPHLKPVCIHLAGTGDHFFWRRRLLTARPLLKESGIASIILENPYFLSSLTVLKDGARKPKQQLRSSLHNVSDLFVMGGALVLESMALLHWCEREGWGPLGISGISMGGHMVSGVATLWPKPISVIPILSWTTASIIFTEPIADQVSQMFRNGVLLNPGVHYMASLAATNWTKPIPLIPCLSWSTASCVFTKGVMSGAIPWETLQEQFFENSIYQDEIKHLIVSPEDLRKNAYSMGQQFVKDYSANVAELPPTVPKITSHCKYEPSISAFEHHALRMRSELPSVTTKVQSGPESLNNGAETSFSAQEFLEKSNHTTQTVTSKGLGVPVELTTPLQEGTMASVPSEMMESSRNKISKKQPDSTFGTESNFLSPASSQVQPPLQSRRHRKSQDSMMPITLSYAKTKGLQQQQRKKEGSDQVPFTQQKQRKKEGSDQAPFTLQHAMAKSNLMESGDNQLHGLREEAFNFMRGVMDECTHLGNFSIPVDPELIIIVSAKQDAYVPRDGVLPLDQLWPGCEVRYIDQGHVGAVLLHQKIFR